MDRSAIANFLEGQSLTVEVTNTRSKRTGSVKIWGNNINGGFGGAHGRWDPSSSIRDGDWQVGDEVLCTVKKGAGVI